MTEPDLNLSGLAHQGSKSVHAYDSIKALIINGTYEPGSRLVLARLAHGLQVSTVPVREAIRRLEAEGLVRFERNVGATVTAVDPKEYFNVMQTLGVVEAAATALAAPLLTNAMIEQARLVNHAMRQSLEKFNPVTFTEKNQEFHTILCGPCPNDYMLANVRRSWDRLSSLRASALRFMLDRALGSLQEHEELLRLITHQAPAEEIEAAARRHRMSTLDAYLSTKDAEIERATLPPENYLSDIQANPSGLARRTFSALD